jgi:virginiamycin B lyase
LNTHSVRRLTWSAAATLTLAALSIVAPAPAGGVPVGCAPATVNTAVSTGIPILDMSENIGYDAAGDLWVARVLRNEVQRYDAAGNVTARVPVFAPGAIRLGPDNLLYVNFGNFTANIVPGSRTGGVVRFDPSTIGAAPEVFATGLGMPNGAAFDDAGYLYVADTSAGVVRIRPDGSIDADWTRQARHFSANGIAVLGDSVYVTIMATPSSQVVRIPIANPAAQSVAAELSPGLTLPAIPDDLVVGSDDQLYVTTTTGRLFRVDPTNGNTCTVLGGEPITSAATVPGRDGQLILGTETGNLLRVQLGN